MKNFKNFTEPPLGVTKQGPHQGSDFFEALSQIPFRYFNFVKNDSILSTFQYLITAKMKLFELKLIRKITDLTPSEI